MLSAGSSVSAWVLQQADEQQPAEESDVVVGRTYIHHFVVRNLPYSAVVGTVMDFEDIVKKIDEDSLRIQFVAGLNLIRSRIHSMRSMKDDEVVEEVQKALDT